MTAQVEIEPLTSKLHARVLPRADEATDQTPAVKLAPTHPGFSDPAYRARRDEIARIASTYQPGGIVPDAPYTAAEDRLWHDIWTALEPAHKRHACAEYLECLRRLDLPRARVPQLREVNERLKRLSGFQLQPVSGLVKSRVFFESLARGVFMCTQYIRHHSTPHYTPEPDVVHELIGHAVWLASEPMAELNRLIGEAVKRAQSAASLKQLVRLYWFTIEFSVLREAGALKAFGTGLLSSAGELEAMHKAELRPLDLDAAVQLDFDPTKYQPILFCADSFAEMYQRLRDYLVRLR